MRKPSIGTWLLAFLVAGSIGVSYYLGIRDARRLGLQYAQHEINTMLEILQEKDDAFFEVERKAAEELAKARADLDSARSALSRVRERLSSCTSSPPLVSGDPPSETDRVRAYVLQQIEDRLSVLARFADESYTAASLCHARTNLIPNRF